MSLISTTKIDDKTPTIKRRELTIKVELWSLEEIPEKLQEMLHHVLHSWNDGRYPFCVEMFQRGLDDSIRWALRSVFEKEAQDEFGHEMVVDKDRRGSTSRWYIESQKRYTKAYKPWLYDDFRVTMEPVQDKS